MAFLYCTTIILIYGMLSSFRLYYIQLIEIKTFWWPRAGGWRPGADYEGRGAEAG